MAEEKEKKPSKTARARSARLVAVQTLYGVMHTGDSMKEAVADVMARSDKLEVDGERLVKPDGILFQKILFGVNERKSDLNEIVEANLNKGKEGKGGDVELLLKSILLCGTFELMAHHDIDTPIIINDYIDVAHGFYEQNQVKLVNGVLDSIAKLLRS
jgi:N utilization substance protein B